MNKFAKDVAIGKYKGREEEQAKIKAKIDQAIVDKRII
jgi:cytochrome c551/c552